MRFFRFRIKGPLKWLRNAASVAGRSLTHTLAAGIKGAGSLIGKVPLIGSPLSSVISFAAAPFAAVDAIVSGARIDRALLTAVKDEVSAIREIAPYARLVVSAIPGLGSGVNAAIAFASAAVAGVPLSEAMVAGVKGALPYGAIGKAVFDYTQKVVSGENVIKATANAALSQLPSQARDALDVVQRAAKGENIPKLALETARKQLPTEVQKALDVGVAIGQGKKLQNALATGIDKMGRAELSKFTLKGEAILSGNPILAAGAAIIKDKQQTTGYKVGAAVLDYAGVNEYSIMQVRSKLTKKAQEGFDIAVSTRIGKITAKLAPKNLSVKGQAAFYATHGMHGGGSNQKAAMMKVLVKDPEGRKGAAIAVAEMPHTWWQQLLAFLGLS